MRRFLAAALLALGAAAAPPALAQQTLAEIRQRGELACGVNGQLPGFSAPDAQGVMRGLDADICRAVAAAALGDAGRVRFVPQATVEAGLDALAQGGIHLLARNATLTFARDAGRPVTPTAVVYYDGMGFLVPRRLGIGSPRELAGRTVCWAGAEGPGTAGDNLTRFAATHALQWTVRRYATQPEAIAALRDGQCDAASADAAALAARRALDLGTPEDWVLLPEVISREPLAPWVRSGDEAWRVLVFWTVQALIEAEELGVSAARLGEALASPDPRVARFVGLQPGMGAPLGLPDDWAARVVAAVGHYGEVFERNLGRASVIGLDRGLNAPWTAGGLLYGMPMR